MNFCPSCGAPATGTPFCGNCGKPMTSAAASAPTREPSAAVASGASVDVGGPSGPSGPTRPAVSAGQPGAAWNNPFADIPVSDYVRDGIALVLLLVSFGMPWDLTDAATGKVYVILVTLLSVISLALPYLQRGGVLPEAWGTAQLRLARLAANVPYVVVVLVTFVLGYVGDDSGDGVGVGIMFGLAGALLAAQGRRAEQTVDGSGDAPVWRGVTVGIAGLFVLLTAISVIFFLLDMADRLEWHDVAHVIVIMLFFLALAVVPRIGAIRGEDAAWRDVLLLLGVVALFVGVWQLAAEENIVDAWSIRLSGPQLLLIPALAVSVSAAGLWTRTERAAAATHWVTAAARACELIVVVECFAVVLYALQIVSEETGRGVAIVVLVLHLVALLAAIVARNALIRDAGLGRGVALICAGLFVLIGIVIAAVLGASESAVVGVADAAVISVLWWFAVAIMVGLTVPRSVRHEFGSVSVPRGPTGVAATVTEAPATAAAPSVDGSVTGPDSASGESAPEDDAAPVTEAPTPADGVAAEPDVAETRVDPAVDSAASSDEAVSPAYTAQTAADPSTPLQTLADIAAREPSLRPHVASNPSAYPELLTWLDQLGDPAVDEALRRRGR